jgi:cholesterol transport system auxiliary component
LTPPSRINAALRLLASAAMATTLVACSGALSTPPTTFDLRAPSEVKPARGARAQLVVAEPSSVQVLDSDRIVVRPKVGEVSYLSGAQWADRLPKLVQARLIQTFENAKRIGSVGSPDDKLSADATLVTEIRTFEIGVADGAVATVEISAKLVSERRDHKPAKRSTRRSKACCAASSAGLRRGSREHFRVRWIRLTGRKCDHLKKERRLHESGNRL